jgi:hypothetical protein
MNGILLLICHLVNFGAKINTNTKNKLATPPIKTMLMMSTTRETISLNVLNILN